MKIDQLLAGYAEGDAISYAARLLREIFRSWGVQSDIYVDQAHVSPLLRSDSRPLQNYQACRQDVCLYHYGIASPATETFFSTPAQRVMLYHNITPHHYFIGMDDETASKLQIARSELDRFGQQVQAVWADSHFNAGELMSVGLNNVNVFRLPYNPDLIAEEPDPRILAQKTPDLKTFLFVGRLAPNKRLEDLIQAFAWYHRAINSFSRLMIVGSLHSVPRYTAMLRMLVGDLDLATVSFEGFASPAGLEAYYRLADVYVSTSEHEGYGLTLLEAMNHKVPVIARKAGGTPEAMQDAGILYDELQPEELAVLFDLVCSDIILREKILHSQVERMQRERERALEDELKTLLASLPSP